jgi:hypothetical protein
MDARFKFKPIHFSWVAIHPQPKGVISFIGGAFFGTFPTIFYRYLLKQIFDRGYTIIALPYRFTFRHWSVAISLTKDQYQLRQEIRAEAKRLGYEYKIYEEEPTSEKPNYFWIGHSLGCKYIALLEILTALEERSIQEVLGGCVGSEQSQTIEIKLQGTDIKDVSLKNQPTVLIAPAITGIEGAIPLRSLAEFIKRLGIDAKPTVEQTHCLMLKSQLFNLMAAITFSKDKIAAPTITWMKENLPRSIKFFDLPGRQHLAPLGIRFGDSQLAADVIKLIDFETVKLQGLLALKPGISDIQKSIVERDKSEVASQDSEPELEPPEIALN